MPILITPSAIISDPEVMDGTPVLTGTRVPFQTLIDYLESGAPLEEFLDDFPSVANSLWLPKAVRGEPFDFAQDRLIEP